MIRDSIDRCVALTTKYNKTVILGMLLLTGVMVAGMGMLDVGEQAEEDADDFADLAVIEDAEYIETHYGDGDDDGQLVAVYMRAEGENVLAKDGLLASLDVQASLLENESVQAAMGAPPRILDVSTLVAVQAGADQGDIADQRATLEALSEEEIEELVREVLSDEAALALMPADFQPGSAVAEDRRVLFHFETEGESTSHAERAMFQVTQDRESFFTLNQHSLREYQAHINQQTAELVIPIALLLILTVLAVTYRDLVDVLVGMTGVVLSMVWMFGLLGWLGIDAGLAMFIGPILIGGLSIDFGFHVFNRYREQRGPNEGIRPPMRRGVGALAIAFGLVTVTAAIGFLSNLANPLELIQELGVAITLGVVAAFIIFVTIVPALKISIDSTLERFGVNRRKRALGTGRMLKPVLSSSVTLATRIAPVVIAIALIAGLAGGFAWTALDEESFQQQTDPAAEWKQDLPGPVAWEDHEFEHNTLHVEERYGPAGEDDMVQSDLLVRGDVTADHALSDIQAGIDQATESGAILETHGTPAVHSPLSVIQSVAARDDEFAATVDRADTTGNGIPDQDLQAVYDHLFEIAPEEAGDVIERVDGEYRTMRVVVTLDGSMDFDERVEELDEAAAVIGDGDAELEATATGFGPIQHHILAEIQDGILQSMVLALISIFLALALFFRLTRKSASLGAVVAIPIALVTGMVIGGMYVLGQPLTLLTALMMSLVIGLGIDYSIHVGDRFAHELDEGAGVPTALEHAVVGTGGALLGSTLTSAGAFAALILHPHPQIQSIGLMTVIALVAAFIAAVFILPSLLFMWSRLVPVEVGVSKTPVAPSDD